MSMDDIALIKTGKMVKPRPAQAASINGMFQTQLHTARQQLSHALYQRDAACRVIARLRKERDESRSLLAQAENRPGVAASFIEELTDGSVALSQQRKRRQIPSTLATVDAVERYTQLSSYPLHKTNTPGILAMDILYSTDIIATGGADTTAVLFNRSSGEILSTLSGHSKKVTGVKIVGQGDSVVTGPADKFDFGEHQRMGMNDCRHILKDHTAEVQAVTVHATNNYFVSASLDNTWCFYDLSSGLCLSQVDGTSGSGGFTSASFHPDGLYLGTGTSESIVQIWDVRSQANLAKFDGHVGAVTAISFSENGYFLATAAHDGVKLWDLRNSKNFKTFAPYDDDAPTQSVEFDHSGRYLAVAGSDIRESNLCEIWPRCEIPCSRINGSQPPRFRFAWGRCDGFLKYFFSYRATEGEAINITPCFWDSFMKFLFSN